MFVFAGNRDVLASPGSYFFLSNSAGQGDEWLKSLNKGVWIPFTGTLASCFDVPVVDSWTFKVQPRTTDPSWPGLGR